jgi:flavin reductase (DIM6/NTAB) family NADH-FMN oxidoreductase RutF
VSENRGLGVTADWQQAVSAAFISAIDYPLYVVTACADGEMSGCLAGFVTQASLDPVRFLVCVSKVNHTYGVARRSRGLGVHLLGSDQRVVASLFGEQSGDQIDKFQRIRWSTGSTGSPILSECAAWIEGKVVDRMDGGDHEAFLITVTAGGAGTRTGRFMRTDATDFEAGHPE